MYSRHDVRGELFQYNLLSFDYTSLGNILHLTCNQSEVEAINQTIGIYKT
jgi:hypothetical protein